MSRPTRVCDRCHGGGKVRDGVDGAIGSVQRKCPVCGGSGDRPVTDGELLELIWDKVKGDPPKVRASLRSK